MTALDHEVTSASWSPARPGQARQVASSVPGAWIGFASTGFAWMGFAAMARYPVSPSARR